VNYFPEHLSMKYLPDSFKTSKEVKSKLYAADSRYIDLGKLEDAEEINVRPCGTAASGHVVAGWEYFSEVQKRTRRFTEFPEDYPEDIGLSFSGRANGTGEKDKPKFFLSAAVLSKELGRVAILTITNPKARDSWANTLSHEAYLYEDGALANFYLTIRREGMKKETSYSLVPAPKAATAAERKLWSEVAPTLWLPALFEGADPFAGRPAEGAPIAAGLPPTSRDEAGADVEPGDLPPAGWA
jgi:hypothetical protein